MAYPSYLRKDKLEPKHAKSFAPAPEEDVVMEPARTDADRLSRFRELQERDLVRRLVPGVDTVAREVPEEVVEYIDQISEHIRTTETEHLAEYGYMKRQRDINEKMRAILVDWLIEVHYKFKLNPETLFITISLIDRYLSVE